MTESGIAPNECELPSDCEPPAFTPSHPCSYYLTLPPRSLAQAVRDVSRVRDLEPWVWDLLRRPSAELISLADARRNLLVRNAGRGV